MLSKRNLETQFGIMLWLLTITVRILRYDNFYAIYLKSNIYNFFNYSIVCVRYTTVEGVDNNFIFE